ncbi:hypothetical protein [Terriglobus sp. ADX1]|uniref:hypothetical protein n=1 Tax=Terriglobus sp. ADX1 TaxID=2794063 RepID=UPI002FE5D254
MRLFKVVFGFLFALGGVACAQTPSAPSLPAVPTTKVIAIGSIVNMPASGTANIMPQEVSDTVRLYLAGKIDQWYVRKDQRGVVFLMNVTSTDEAHSLLEKLPLGVAGIMKFDLIPVGPLSPLNYLLPKEK